jgi:hypothetical protein
MSEKKKTSAKKIQANKLNAQKSTGPKTEEGKAVVRMNSLRHGLLAEVSLIRSGDGQEEEAKFIAVLQDLCEGLSPVGALEEMLVERIAACYWRLRRAAKFEVGVLREELDTALSDYSPILKWKDREVDLFVDFDVLVEEEKEEIAGNRHCIKLLKDGLALDKEPDEKLYIDVCTYYYNLISAKYDTWDETYPGVDFERFNDGELTIGEMRAFLIGEGWTDQTLRENFIQQDLQGIAECEKRIGELVRRRRSAEMQVSRLIQMKSLPNRPMMERILRYETTIERQMYRALNQLERLQRQRTGDNVPPPLAIEIGTDGE